MKKFASNSVSHFIAINYHGFHDVNTALDCIHSVLLSASGLSGQVEITFFNHSGRPVTTKLADGLEDLNVTRRDFSESSNGEALNMQIERAKGFSFFYRVDADDLVSPGRFKWQSQLLANSECDICGGGLIYHNIETGREFHVLPPEMPGTISYLFNQYFLHPTLAFRLETFTPRYGKCRLEDKELAFSALKSKLTVFNDQRVYGIYNLNPNARNGNIFAHRDFKLNLDYIQAAHSYWALPLAYGLFAASLLISRQKLRNIRKVLIPKSIQSPDASSEFACDNAKAERNQPPSS